MSIDQIYQIPTHAHDLIDFHIGSLVLNKYSNIIYEVVEHRKGVTHIRNIDSGYVEQYNSCNNRYFYDVAYIHPAMMSLIIK